MIDIFSFEELDEIQRNAFRSRCEIPGGGDPDFVILAGSKEDIASSSVPPVITYEDSRSALIHSRGPVTLAVRGEMHALLEGAVYFIPAARSALMKKKILFAAAALVLVSISAVLLLTQDRPNLPEAYLAYLDPGFAPPGEIITASGESLEGEIIEQRLENHINALLTDSTKNFHWQNKEFIPFFERVVDDTRLNVRTRRKALLQLMESAISNDLFGLVLEYRDHPEAFIREEVELKLSAARKRFEAAGFEVTSGKAE